MNTFNIETLYQQLGDTPKMGDIRKLAKEIKKNHDFALELWESDKYALMLLALLCMDPKQLNQDTLIQFDADISSHFDKEKNILMDWLMANQLLKDKNLKELVETWIDSPLPLQRRTYWYAQGRARWSGQENPPNTEALLTRIEKDIQTEDPDVQWAMNFVAGWIGIYQEQYRDRCIQLGLDTQLYINEKVSKGCTPTYLPEFIRIEVDKRK